MISSNPMSYDVDWFGLVYHGLYVVERPWTQGYIRLKDGRRIYSTKPVSGIMSTGFSVLIDNGMPAVIKQPDEPGAELWNVAIAGGWPGQYVYPLEYRDRVSVRRDLASGELCEVYGNNVFATRPSPLSAGVVAVSPPYQGTGIPRMNIPQSEHGVPMDVITNPDVNPGATVLDVSPDGHRFLIMISDQKENENLFVAEIVVSDRFTQAVATVVAGYDIVAPREDRADGERLKSMAIVIKVEDGSVQHLDADAASGYGWPDYVVYGYTTGSSTATATAESVIGAWYTDSGQVELVHARKTATSHWRADTPVQVPQPGPVGTLRWVSPHLEEHTISVSIRAGNKETGALSITSVDDNTGPPTRTYSIYSSTGEHIERSETREYYSNYLRTVPYASAWTAPTQLSASFTGTMEITARNLSDKLYAPLILIKDSSGRPNYNEYIAGDAVTPKGVDLGVKKSGNVYAGLIGPGSPEYDEEIREIARQFLVGAYNPVTGEVERNRNDGFKYVWV